jgi:hypothetical protein
VQEANLKNLVFLAVSLTTSLAVAETDVLAEKVLRFGPSGGAQIIVRHTDHPPGLPYLIEVRAQCADFDLQKVKAAHLTDATNVCDVKPKSIKLSEDGKDILITVRDSDAVAINRQSKEARPDFLGEVEPICQKEGRELRFNIGKLCSGSR